MNRIVSMAVVTAFACLIGSSLFAASDTRTVQAEFDRCESLMERNERSLKRYENELSIMKRTLPRVEADRKEVVVQEFETLENRLEYFRNRYARAQGQADKIRGDLKNINGPTCPSCVESSVNLYCRNGENLQTEIDEYLAKAADLSAKTGMRHTHSNYPARRAAADSALAALQDMIDSCADRAAAALAGQARINALKADSLHAAGDESRAFQALDIAQSLLEKAAKRCGVAK